MNIAKFKPAIVYTIYIASTPEKVWQALTSAEFSRKYFFGNAVEVDLRVGGAWRFVGQGPEGQFPAFHGVYREIAAPGRLVYTEIFEPFPDVESVVTQILTREGRKTRLTVTSSYPSLEVRDMVLQTGMEKGAALSYDRLDDVAQELARIER